MEVLLPLLLALPPAALALIGVSLAAGVFIAASMFLIAYALQSAQMVAVAKEEFAALLFSVIILFFWFSFDTTINAISNGLVMSALPPQMQSVMNANPLGGMAASHVSLAMASLKIMETRLVEQYKDLYTYEMLIGFLSTISFPIGSPLPAVGIISLSFAPFVGLTLLSNAHTMIVESVGYLITVLWAKEFILIFSRDAVPLLLFPMGLILRAVPFFRRTGSSVIAIAFAMYFVFPFSLLLSNYLVFDVFKPADFAYTPSSASYYSTDKDQSEWETDIGNIQKGPAEDLLTQFKAPSALDTAFKDPASECVGNPVYHFFCSASNIVSSAWGVAASVATTTWNILRFMVGMTGDFFWTMFTNPMMPASTSAGLYYFIIQEVLLVAPFLILVTLLTVVEIILTLTMYRNIALLIGGEAELIGISKVV